MSNNKRQVINILLITLNIFKNYSYSNKIMRVSTLSYINDIRNNILVKTQKFINVELLCDGRARRKIQRGRRAAPTSWSKNNGIVRIECERVRKLRTAKNAEKSKKPGNRGEWLEDGWNGARG